MEVGNEKISDIAIKMNIINKIINKGYEYTYNSIGASHKEFCNSIKGCNYIQIREELMSELYPLIN